MNIFKWLWVVCATIEVALMIGACISIKKDSDYSIYCVVIMDIMLIPLCIFSILGFWYGCR